MSKRDLISSTIAGLILSLLVMGFFFYGDGGLNALPAKAQTNVDSIRQLMLIGHANWVSLTGEASTTWYLSDGQNLAITSEFSIISPDKARFEMPSDGVVWASNGDSIFEIDGNELTYFRFDQPDIDKAISMLPTNLGATSDEIYRYPLAMWIPSPIADYIYPTGLAQREGDYELINEETILDRKAWIISYQLKNEMGDVTMSAKYWVDQEFGFILRAEVYSTDPNTLGKLIEETVFQRIEVNPAIPDGTFSPSLEGYELVEPEQQGN